MSMVAQENNITKLLDLARELSNDDPEQGTALLLRTAACLVAERWCYFEMATEAWQDMNGGVAQ